METFIEVAPYVAIGLLSLVNTVISFLSQRKTGKIANAVGVEKKKLSKTDKLYKDLLDKLIAELSYDDNSNDSSVGGV